MFKEHGYHSIIAGKIFHRYKLLMSKLQNSMIAGENSPRNITSCKSKRATNVSGRTTSVYLLVAFSRLWIKILAGLTMRQDPERTTTSPGRKSSTQTRMPTMEFNCPGTHCWEGISITPKESLCLRRSSLFNIRKSFHQGSCLRKRETPR